MKGRLEDLKLALQPKKLYLPRQARRYARKTEKEIGLLPHLVPAGCTAIDGGANKGVYSWWLSRLCKRVLAFEPNPQMYAYMSKAVPSNVEPYPLALAMEEGVRRFNLPTTGGKVHHTRGSLYDVKAGSDNKTFEVKTTSIDALGLDELGFIKLDLEGAELECLRGALATLDRCRWLITGRSLRVHDRSRLRGHGAHRRPAALLRQRSEAHPQRAKLRVPAATAGVRCGRKPRLHTRQHPPVTRQRFCHRLV